jgi:glycosyltransferase involved in cell wall biosynthesis
MIIVEDSEADIPVHHRGLATEALYSDRKRSGLDAHRLVKPVLSGLLYFMKLLFVCPSPVSFDLASVAVGHIGGIELCNVELSRALAEMGHDVELATPTDRVVRVDGVSNGPLAALLDRAASKPYDAVISSNDARPLASIPASAKVLWVHNPIALEKAVRRRQLTAYFSVRPHAVFVGQQLAQGMSRLYPFASREVIPHGVQNQFHATHDRPIPAHARFIWASQPHRGLKPTLDAWISAVHPKVPEAEFHIYGATLADVGHDAAFLAAHGVTVFGRVDRGDLVDAYRSATAMLYPGADDETFCLAAAEAQACGVPVVTLGRGALRERVQHGINGVIADSFAELAHWAVRLARHGPLASLLSAGAMACARPLTWHRAGCLWQSYLDRVCPGGS